MYHHTHLTLEDIYCYFSRTFSIVFDGTNLNVYRESDHLLIDQVETGYDKQVVHDCFHALKSRYIFDYDNELK